MFQNPELKLDKEFEDLLHTDTDCTPLSIPFFYKKIKRTYDGNKIPCSSCNGAANGNIEGSLDCPYCEALGYQWTEGIYKGWFYKQSYMTDRSISASVPLDMAIANFNKVFLVYDKGLELKQDDIVFKPKLNSEGIIEYPIISDGMFKVFESEHNASNQKFSEFNSATLSSTFGKYFRGILK